MTTPTEATAEEIVGYKEVIDSMTSWEEYYREKHAKELLDLVIEQATAQRLSELKDPSKIKEVLMKDDFDHLRIEDKYGFTGEWRMSNKHVLDVILQLIEEVRDE